MERRRDINLYDNPTPGPSSSQASQSSSTTIIAGSQSSTVSAYTPASSLTSSSEDVETVRDLVQSILIMHQTKVPFRRIDMAKMLDIKKVPDSLIESARQHLKSVFGYELMQVEGNETHYIIVRANKKPCFTQRPLDTDVHDAVLVLVLAVIFMTAETGCPLEKISEFLNLIGMEDETEIWTGSENMKVKDLLTRQWVKQLYLQKFDNEDILTKRNETTIGWGFRARQEYETKQMLQLVSDVMSTEPHVWREQFARAHEDDDDVDVSVISQSPVVARTGRSSSQRAARGVGGGTHRLIVDLTHQVRRGILSESNRINRPDGSQSSTHSRR